MRQKTHKEWVVARGINPRVYYAWVNMRNRCLNPNNPGYVNYGGRGVTVCKRWKKIKNFIEDMGPHPGRGWSLDRINVNGNYIPSNCRWTTSVQQGQNTRRTKLSQDIVAAIRASPYAYGDKVKLAKKLNITYDYLFKVLNKRKWKEDLLCPQQMTK
jgi:hypothetical protein